MPTAKSGNLVSIAVPSGATVVLSGISPLPTVSGTGTIRTFTVPIITAANQTLVITVNGTATNLTITPTKRRVRYNGAWTPSYKVVGPYTTVPDVVLDLSSAVVTPGTGTAGLSGSGTATATGRVAFVRTVAFSGGSGLSIAASTGSTTTPIYPAATLYPSSTTYPGGGASSISYAATVGFSGSGSISGSGSASQATAQPTVSNLYSSQTPAIADSSDGQAIALGTRFSADVDGQITGLRMYRATTSPSSAVGTLYSDAGAILATATFPTLAPGWNSVTFASPVSIIAGTVYRAAYWTNGPYVATSGLTPFSNGRLSALDSRYLYTNSSTTMPTNQSAAGYFADVTSLVHQFPGLETCMFPML